jgi:hypothetical protein
MTFVGTMTIDCWSVQNNESRLAILLRPFSFQVSEVMIAPVMPFGLDLVNPLIQPFPSFQPRLEKHAKAPP